jgi:DNA polymerase-4/DNA polymerase V
VTTALQFAQKPEPWVRKYFSKPFQEIWQELNGTFVFALALGEQTPSHSIQKVKTFTPPSQDKAFVWA